MKKAAAILLGMMLLSGCANDKNKNAGVDKEGVDQDFTGEVVETEDQYDVPEVDIEKESPEVSENNEALTDFPEQDVLAEHIDLDVYKSIIETDNQGTRVILFVNADGHKEFKSIFVKHDNRLKIIKLDDDGLLFNDIINK